MAVPPFNMGKLNLITLFVVLTLAPTVPALPKWICPVYGSVWK
jgi:hypothetical protein